MTTAATLIPELDDIVRHGDPKRRADAARRIGDLFLQGAAGFRADHVASSPMRTKSRSRGRCCGDLP